MTSLWSVSSGHSASIILAVLHWASKAAYTTCEKYASQFPQTSLKAFRAGHFESSPSSASMVMTIASTNWLVLVTALSLVLLGRFSRKKLSLENLPGPVPSSWLRGRRSHCYIYNADSNIYTQVIFHNFSIPMLGISMSP